MESPPTVDPAIEAARNAGFDIDLIDTNLALPVEERWRQHNMALEILLKFERARVERDARLSGTA
ncbi:MAG: hypothetical protein JSS11_05100 [Verrucomicrobia bacterium]|nr:hypothetical protein [Verrucomicrobiota bacterium]